MVRKRGDETKGKKKKRNEYKHKGNNKMKIK